MKTLIFVLISCSLFAQLETINVYYGLDISYLTRKDTVLMSLRKWNDVVGILRVQNTAIVDYKSLSGKYEKDIRDAELQITEYKGIVKNLDEKVNIYQGAYNMSADKIVELNNLWQQGMKYANNERKRGIFIGTTWGIIGGFAAGIITSVILFK